MRYSSIIVKLLNNLVTTSFLARLNVWSLLNIKFFFFKSTTVIFTFLSNLKMFKIKFYKFNNYLLFSISFVFFLIILIFFFYI